MYQYLFGPVPSRRLGMSLGIDLVPKKVCSLDCVYCECGHTTKLTIDRKEYIPFNKIVKELDHYFTSNPDPDYITFSGSGEPTLNSQIGDVLHFIKQRKADIPVAVLTNGTLLYQKQVRKNIKSYREDIETAILETIYRRPCTAEDLAGILGKHINEMNKYLDVMAEEGKIDTRRKERGIFYMISNKNDLNS